MRWGRRGQLQGRVWGEVVAVSAGVRGEGAARTHCGCQTWGILFPWHLILKWKPSKTLGNKWRIDGELKVNTAEKLKVREKNNTEENKSSAAMEFPTTFSTMILVKLHLVLLWSVLWINFNLAKIFSSCLFKQPTAPNQGKAEQISN